MAVAFRLYSFKNGITFKRPSKSMRAGGQFLKKRFKKLKMSSKDVATEIGVPKKIIKKFYRGYTYFSYDKIYKICALAQIDPMEYINACKQIKEKINAR
jgi:plasmid maintenance system antidote protein VapI